MSKKLTLGVKADGGDFALPLESATESSGILAKKGAGKSNAAVVLAEELHACGVPWVAVDPKGDWWGVRARGTGPGLPVPVFGGLHGDLPLEPGAGALLADVILGEPGRGYLTAVLDVSQLSLGDQRRFLRDFGARLFHRKGQDGVLHLFLEEAHEYLPQVVRGESAELVSTWQRIVKQGRFKGLGVTVISQRSAALNKDVLTQVDSLYVLRTMSPQDRAAVKAWLDVHIGASAVIQTLHELKNGEAWLWSPDRFHDPIRFRFRRRATFDSGATPVFGSKSQHTVTLADVDLGEIREKMAATIEKAKADDPRELRRQVVDLAKQLAAAQKTSKEVPKQEVQRVEVPIFKDEDYQRMEAVGQTLTKVAEDFRETVLSARRLALEARQRQAIVSPAPTQRQPSASLQPRPSRAAAPTMNGQQIKGGKFRALLVALAQAGKPLAAEQLVARAGMSMSGTFDTYIGQFRQHGWIDGTRAGLQLTQAGRDALGDYEPLPTGEDLRRYWLSQVSGGKERSMLEAIFDAYPDTLDAQAVASRAQMSLSGTFDTYIGHLRRLLLVDGPRSALRANPELFE